MPAAMVDLSTSKYNRPVFQSDENKVFNQITEEQMINDLKKSEEDIVAGRVKPFDSAMYDIRKRLDF